ncbi:serine/threonine-protein kinase HT1-like isoform X1 [Cucurbita maxima]|uniref:Serine/threonine-protein kinase HT1-like isoform X1 n=1 Tax=Cucurbita maxima TaxID=3661 RepID=A0A6J1JZ06_CUCMA|nr:serine/threonine-protein kinase HT1-like isoform X1 [Cucurbita maxima]
MEDDPNSWLRRTKFSHTICYRLESLRLSSFPITAPYHHKSTLNKQRSLSPPSQTTLLGTFKDARNDSKRFSTPQPRRQEPRKEKGKRVFNKEAKVHNFSKEEKLRSPVRHLASCKGNERSTFMKEGSWTKLFEHKRGKVTAVDAVDEFSVDLSKLYFGFKFAYGAHSCLYHGLYFDQVVAIKVINLPKHDENGDLAGRITKQFGREVILLSRLHHPNVIKLVAACRKPGYWIITEYLSQGSLRAYLHKLENKSLPLQKLIAIALDIARGMEYIHSQRIIHRDLKPENVLIDQDFCLKIADFGIACEEAHCDTLADDLGTYRWMAPEMIKRKHYGRKVDLYSFGLILWELVAGRIPYENMTPIQAAYAVVNKVIVVLYHLISSQLKHCCCHFFQNIRPVVPSECPPVMRGLIEQCLLVQPANRPEFWEVVKVLEQLESSVGGDGTLVNVEQKPSWEVHKKGLKHWIQKLGTHHSHTSLSSKSKFI